MITDEPVSQPIIINGFVQNYLLLSFKLLIGMQCYETNFRLVMLRFPHISELVCIYILHFSSLFDLEGILDSFIGHINRPHYAKIGKFTNEFPQTTNLSVHLNDDTNPPRILV